MQKINTAAELREAIAHLEARQANEARLFREELQEAYEALSPVNLIKNTLNNVFKSEEVKDNILNTSALLVSGLLAKALFSGIKSKKTRKVLISAAMVGITNAVSNNPEAVRNFALNAFNTASNGIKSLIGKLRKDRKEPQENNTQAKVTE